MARFPSVGPSWLSRTLMRVKPQLQKKFYYSTRNSNGWNCEGRGSAQHAKSDWMEMEKERAFLSQAVMRFLTMNVWLTCSIPGTWRLLWRYLPNLTAVDSCLMVIDAAKGVEDRTRKLMEVTWPPILQSWLLWINDRDIRPMELLDEAESELNMACAPITWPIGCGKEFKGVYHIHRDETVLSVLVKVIPFKIRV